MPSLLNRLSASGYEMVFRAMARRRPPRAEPIKIGENARILCFTCAGIGDTLTDSVVFKALRETYPQAHLAAVVHRRRRLLVEHNPCINQVFLFHKGPPTFWKLQKQLRAAGPWSAILQLRGNDPEPRCLSFMVDPNVTVSVPNMTKLSYLCGHQLAQPDWDATHGVEQTLRIARYIGANTKEPHLVYAVHEEDELRLEEKLRRMLIARQKPRIVLQLGGGRRASWRDWPVERYAQLIRLCAHELDASVFVLGGDDQQARLKELDSHFKAGTKPYHDMVGKLSLAESAALLASAQALVSTDTGIMHLGFAVGTRVVAIIHCNNPATRVGPHGYGHRHRVVQLAKPADYRTPADASMADVPAQTVFPAPEGDPAAMNFPGLDPTYTFAHKAAHALRLINTWSAPQAREALESGEKVLVVATTALGDSLLTTPLIETLAHGIGHEYVSLLVKTPYAELYQHDPRLDRVFTVRGKYRWGGLREKLEIDPHRIALLANMTEPDLVPFLYRCGVRGFLRYRTRWTRYPHWMANEGMLRRPGAADYATGHAIENNLAMAKALGVEAVTHRLSLPHLRPETPTRENLVLIHPGASREIKRWPVENWAALADALAERFGCTIALTGDRSEHSLTAHIAATMRTRPQILAGKISLRALAVLQASALAFLSGDTGPYHLAVAMECPTLTLFAPTDRGSSVEACGPHQAPAKYHRAIQTAKAGDAIHTIPLPQVLAEAIALVEASLARPTEAAA